MILGFISAAALAIVLVPLGIGIALILPQSISVTVDGEFDENKMLWHLAEVTSGRNGSATLSGILVRKPDPKYAERLAAEISAVISDEYRTNANFGFMTRTGGYLAACHNVIVWHTVEDESGTYLSIDMGRHLSFRAALEDYCSI